MHTILSHERLGRVKARNAFSLLKLFSLHKNFDSMFYWEIQLNEDQRLINILWVDAIYKMNYEAFGDIIIFDISYRISKYNLICAPIIDISNHRINIFWCCLFN
ncbi:Protein FAR1-like sequence 3 [Apostasia shenzhenica]|uniref:Protein FAR1-like sequence 3 n=1 Tax=Apostasia shenzhenica TaxID=1088818 RepID=A0A2I0API3_9ASPA|nr:Protein FAR1-like sequence 3 [Apostasia shenzhenica]